MKVFKYLPLAILLSCATSVLQAQEKGTIQLDLKYNYSLPLSGFKNDVISNGSPRGFKGNLMFTINPAFSVGFETGFQDYYQKYARAEYQTGNHEVTSAVLSNSIQTIPFMLSGMYQPMAAKAGFIQPYVGVATGISSVNFSQYLGEFGGSDNNAAFTLEGSAGIRIPFSKNGNSGFSIGAAYQYMPYKKYGLSDLNNVSFNAGVHIPLK